jgi:hypothetical protein
MEAILYAQVILRVAFIDTTRSVRQRQGSRASVRRIGAEKIFPTRVVQKPSSVPTLLPARRSFGYDDNLPVQYVPLNRWRHSPFPHRASAQKQDQHFVLLRLSGLSRVECRELSVSANTAVAIFRVNVWWLGVFGSLI